VVGVGRQKQVLREIHFHAMSLPDRDGGRNLHESVKDSVRRLRDAGRGSVGERLGTVRGDGAAALRDLACPGNHAQSDRSTEDFKVVIVYLVLKPFLSDLVEPVELVEIDGVTIRHNQAMEDDSDSPLLADARGSNLLRFP